MPNKMRAFFRVGPLNGPTPGGAGIPEYCKHFFSFFVFVFIFVIVFFNLKNAFTVFF